MSTFEIDVNKAKGKQLLNDVQKKQIVDFFEANPNVDLNSNVERFAKEFNCSLNSVRMALVQHVLTRR